MTLMVCVCVCACMHSKVSVMTNGHLQNIPNNGMDSEVSGNFSEMANIKTENASSTVTPNAIFSPDSGGRQKTSNVSVDIMMHGNMTLYV